MEDRTESLDATVREIREHRLVLPKQMHIIEEFAAHLQNITKVIDEDIETGAMKPKYIKTGEDHYAHARNYCRIAESKYKDRGKVNIGFIS